MSLSSSMPVKIYYWAPGAVDGFGKKSFSSPTTVRVRWQDRQEEFVDQEGHVQRSRTIVYSHKKLLEGGYLFKGDLEMLTTEQKAAPEKLAGARLIGSAQESPSLHARIILYKAMLK